MSLRPEYCWPSPREAQEALLAHAGDISPESVTVRQMSLGELEDRLRAHAPAVVEIVATGEAIAVPRPGKVLAREGGVSRAKWSTVRRLWEDPARASERLVFAKIAVDAKAAEKVISQRIAGYTVATVTHFAAPPGRPFREQLAATGWFARLRRAVAAHALAYLLGVAAWALIANAALSGRWDNGWFWGWVILLAIGLPVELFAVWWQGWLSLALGGLLKQRLLAGSLEIDTDRIRHQGIGQLMSRVLESDSLEAVSMTGGAAAVLSLVEVPGAIVVLGLGATPLLTVGLFLAWLLLIGAVTRRYARLRKEWMSRRNLLTHDLVEKMNGHRTRIAQQPPELWHEAEDDKLAAYLQASSAMDRLHAWMLSVAARGWLTVGMAAVGFAFVRNAASPELLAISTGGVLLGYQTLRRVMFGVAQLAGAAQAWDVVRDLFQAAAQQEVPEARTGTVSPSSKVVEARGVAYSYPGRERQVLEGCSLEIHAGERVLLQGTSGSGKSTFGTILSGLRRQTGGLLLAGGLDYATLGPQGWRRQVATAPQYHENHVMAAPLHFNLLMGRAWPASPEDMKEAWEVCQELGLEGLLQRMPAGLAEMVGDTGWQMSQGERSRVFLARALLQGAPLVILDESFAALDPETLEQCLQCVLRRAPSLLVIAHP